MKPLNFLEMCGIDEYTIYRRPDFNDEEFMNKWLNECLGIRDEMRRRGCKTMNLLDLVGIQPINRPNETEDNK